MKKSFKSVLTFALALVMMVTCMAVTVGKCFLYAQQRNGNYDSSVDHRALMFPRQLLHTTRVVIQTTAVKQVD